MEMNSSKVYHYVGNFLPTKLILRTRIPAKWENHEYLENRNGNASIRESLRAKYQKKKMGMIK